MNDPHDLVDTPGAEPRETTRCLDCQGALPPGARFCPTCGTPVGADSPGEERRIVSVLFADIEGFTALAERLDPEQVKEMLDTCFGGLVPVIHDHGGHVDKIIGDEIMAIFGAPTAHGDDPERAVRAAMALGAALAEVDTSLRLRVGVNTGEVVAGAVGPANTYTVIGDVVNTAHRLVTAASSGEVLVGESTRHATRDVVVYRSRGTVDLKGKSDPVPVWAAVGRIEPSGVPVVGPGRPLIGRARDIEVLQGSVVAALNEAQTEVVTLVGEAGVGKTRLLTELASLVSGPPIEARVLWTTCPPYGPGGNLGPLGDLVRLALDLPAGLEPSEQVERLGDRLAALGAGGGEGGVLQARLEGLLGLARFPARAFDSDPGPMWSGILDQQMAAVRSVFKRLAAAGPVLVVVDDLHWASDEVLEFFAQLPEKAAGLHLVVLAGARDDLLERRSPITRIAPGRSTRTLEPLGASAMAELASLHLARERPDGEAVLGPAAAESLVAVAGGNPLVLEQLIHYVVESGALVRSEGHWHWAGNDLSPAQLPDGVRSLISARLDGLPADERALLMTASIFGRRFWREGVRQLTDFGGAVQPDEVDPVLARLDERGLTEAVSDVGYGDHAFSHVLTRDVAYASLPIVDRAASHARAASWLDRRSGDEPEAAAITQLAHHYERAVVLARSVDHTDAGLSSAAFSALLRAARDAHRRAGLRQADHWYRRARDLGSFDVDLALAAIAEHGQVLLELRHLDSARAAFEELLQRSERRDPAVAASAIAHLAAVNRLSGDGELARERFEEAARRWQELGDRQGQADALRLEGWCDITAGRFRAALPRLQHADALEANLSEAPRRGETLQYLGWCEFLAGDIEQARQHLWAAMQHSSDRGDPGAIGWCFGLLAFTMLLTGDATQALEVSRNLWEVARDNSDSSSEWTCATLVAAALASLGEVDEGGEIVARAEMHFEELGDSWGLALSRVVRSQILRAQGELAEARQILERSIAANQALSYVGEDARLTSELARVELEMGDLDEAERQGRAALALVRAGIGDQESGLRSICVLAAVEDARGQAAEAQLLLEEAAAPRAPGDRTEAWRQAALALARHRLAAGDRKRAEDLLAACEDPRSEDVRTQVGVAELRDRLAGAD